MFLILNKNQRSRVKTIQAFLKSNVSMMHVPLLHAKESAVEKPDEGPTFAPLELGMADQDQPEIVGEKARSLVQLFFCPHFRFSLPARVPNCFPIGDVRPEQVHGCVASKGVLGV